MVSLVRFDRSEFRRHEPVGSIRRPPSSHRIAPSLLRSGRFRLVDHDDEEQPDESTFDDVSERIERLLSWIKDPEQFFKDFIAEEMDDILWKSVVEEYNKEN